MQRPAAELRCENHGEKIKRAGEESSNAELRPTGGSRMMRDLDLANSEAVPMQQRRDIAVQLTVDLQVLQAIGTIRLKAAVEVMNFETRDSADEPVEDRRRERLVDRVVPNALAPAHHVVALVELVKEAGHREHGAFHR